MKVIQLLLAAVCSMQMNQQGQSSDGTHLTASAIVRASAVR